MALLALSWQIPHWHRIERPPRFAVTDPDGPIAVPMARRVSRETGLVRMEVTVMTIDHPARHRPSGRLALLPLLVALLGSLVSAGAVTAGNGATIIRGVQLEYGSCGGTGYRMTGSLDGCWWIDTFESKTDPARSNFRATGTEHFEGCLGTICGSFTTDFSFTAKMDGPWQTSAEIHGRCHHPITGGTRGFEGATGQISFHDVVDVSPPYYPYVGNIHLAGADGGTTRIKVSSSAATDGSTTGTAC